MDVAAKAMPLELRLGNVGEHVIVERRLRRRLGPKRWPAMYFCTSGYEGLVGVSDEGEGMYLPFPVVMTLLFAVLLPVGWLVSEFQPRGG